MNDDTIHGFACASLVVRSLEAEYSGYGLLQALNDEVVHATRVAQLVPAFRDEYYGRAKLYMAAFRRHAEQEALHAA